MRHHASEKAKKNLKKAADILDCKADKVPSKSKDQFERAVKKADQARKKVHN